MRTGITGMLENETTKEVTIKSREGNTTGTWLVDNLDLVQLQTYFTDAEIATAALANLKISYYNTQRIGANGGGSAVSATRVEAVAALDIDALVAAGTITAEQGRALQSLKVINRRR